MTQKFYKLSRRYVAALRKHVGGDASDTLRQASLIGHRAVAQGLETLQLAGIHERALGTLKPSATRQARNKRAQSFFAQALIPIIETHRSALKLKSDMVRLNQVLALRTSELANCNNLLQVGLVRQRTIEATLKKTNELYVELLEESVRLQDDLRQLAHKGFTVHEAERKKISHELKDEVAQLLLSVNVRLLAMRRGRTVSATNLENEIAIAQELVAQSVTSVRDVVSLLKSSGRGFPHPKP